MLECYRGTTPRGSVSSLERTDVLCSKIYRRAACSAAWYEASIAYTTPRHAGDGFDGKSNVQAIVDRCRADYCADTKTAQPALCSASAPLTKTTFTAFVAWLLLEELTFPDDEAMKWAKAPYYGSWLQ